MNKAILKYVRFCRSGFIIPAILSLSSALTAQYSSNSLYSLYGLGDMKSNGPVKTSAMGGAGIALQSENFINNLNPASLTRYDSTTFLFSAGINGFFGYYESRNKSLTDWNLNFNHLALGFPITKWWGAAAGVVPLSSVSYDVLTAVSIEGTNKSIEAEYTGEGGVNQFYMMNSFHLFKQLSIGANVSYLMGTVKKTQTVKLENFDFTDISRIQSRYFRSFNYSFGLQFNQQIKNSGFTVGFTFNPKQKLNTRYDLEVMIPGVDTIKSEKDVESDFTLPVSIGAGLAGTINSKLEFAFDYGLQRWSDVSQNDDIVSLTDSYHYNFGLQYMPDQKISRSYLRLIRYRMGAYFEKTYIEMRGNAIQDYGITLGAGFPIGRQRSMIDLALGAGRLGTLNDGLVQQTYISFKLGFNFHDYWFIKRRFD